MSTTNLFTNSAPTRSHTAVNSGMDGAQQTEGETLFQQASQSHQPEVLIKRQFEQRSQSQKSKLANEFIASAGREGISQLAATPDGQHALAVVYDHAGSDGRGTMRQVHEEQGNTAVDYTERNAFQYDLDSIAAMPDKRGYFERIGDELRGSVVVDQPLGERLENTAVAAYSGDPNDNLDGIESRALVAKGWARSLVDGLQGVAQDPIGIIRDPAILGYDQLQTAFYSGTGGLLGDQNSMARNQERTESLQNFVEAVKTSTNDPEKIGYLVGGALLGIKKGKISNAPTIHKPGQGLTGKGWVFNSGRDIDLRGQNSTWHTGLDAAFERIEALSGITRDQFKPIKRAYTRDGKSVVVEWEGPRGANVNLDIPKLQIGEHGLPKGPSEAHIGWKASGKFENGRGHVFVDGDLPASRTRMDVPDLEF